MRLRTKPEVLWGNLNDTSYRYLLSVLLKCATIIHFSKVYRHNSMYVCMYISGSKLFLRCSTPRLHCFLSSHWPSFRFLSFMAFFILSIQFFFSLHRALFCFGIHFNAILGSFSSAILWTWPYHVSWFCSISFIIVSSSPICYLIVIIIIICLSVMELGHLLTRSGLTYPEVSSKVCHDSFYQLGSSVSVTWVVGCEAFCLRVVSSSSGIPVFCLELVLCNGGH